MRAGAVNGPRPLLGLLASAQTLAMGADAGTEPMAEIKGPGKRGGKSNTERSRQYRLAKRQSGGAELSLFINPAAVAALQIIVAHDRSTQTQAIERALMALATKCAPDARAIHDLVLAGTLDAATAQAWRSQCAQPGAFVDQTPASDPLNTAAEIAVNFKEST